MSNPSAQKSQAESVRAKHAGEIRLPGGLVALQCRQDRVQMRTF